MQAAANRHHNAINGAKHSHWCFQCGHQAPGLTWLAAWSRRLGFDFYQALTPKTTEFAQVLHATHGTHHLGHAPLFHLLHHALHLVKLF